MDHSDADQEEQTEGQPVVERLYQGAERKASGPAEDVHAALEKTEMPGQPEGVAEVYLRQGDPGRQGDGKGINCQGQSYHQDRNCTHQCLKIMLWPGLQWHGAVIRLVNLL